MKTHFDHIYQLATVSSRAKGFSVLGIPTRDTHFTRDLGMGIPKTRGYPNHCDSASSNLKMGKSPRNEVGEVSY